MRVFLHRRDYNWRCVNPLARAEAYAAPAVPGRAGRQNLPGKVCRNVAGDERSRPLAANEVGLVLSDLPEPVFSAPEEAARISVAAVTGGPPERMRARINAPQ
jgi:hypothetical protein